MSRTGTNDVSPKVVAFAGGLLGSAASILLFVLFVMGGDKAAEWASAASGLAGGVVGGIVAFLIAHVTVERSIEPVWRQVDFHTFDYCLRRHRKVSEEADTIRTASSRIDDGLKQYEDHFKKFIDEDSIEKKDIMHLDMCASSLSQALANAINEIKRFQRRGMQTPAVRRQQDATIRELERASKETYRPPINSTIDVVRAERSQRRAMVKDKMKPPRYVIEAMDTLLTALHSEQVLLETWIDDTYGRAFQRGAGS